MPIKDLKIILAFGVVLLLASPIVGQSPSPLTLATPDGNVPIPVTTGALGQQDAAALAELTSHKAAVGSDPWIGMQGTGTITYDPQDSTGSDATLSNLGTDKFRLDVQTPKGQTSLRILRRVGSIQESDATFSTLPVEAAIAGLFPFELLRSSHFPGPTASLIDHGMVQIGSTLLHRITLERPSVGRNPVTHSAATMATDLYFDPTSHLLVKSVSSVPVADARPVKFLFVVTYSDYRSVGNSMIPFRYSETMEGRQYRTVQLSTVQLNPSLDNTYFEF